MKPVRLAATLVAASVLLSATAVAQTDPKKTERTWKSKCASCHGATGKGDTDKGKELKVPDMATAGVPGEDGCRAQEGHLRRQREGQGPRLQGRADARAD